MTRISAKAPSDLTRSALMREIEKLQMVNSGLLQEVIARGWGHLRHSEIGKLSDPLAVEYTVVGDRLSRLLREVEYRKGQGHWKAERYNPRKNPPKKKRSSKKRTRAFQIQSVLLEIDYFTPTRARVWLQSNGHKFGNLEESDRFYHARQYDPGDYQHGTLHNIQLAKHVEAVVGIPIEGTPAYEAKGYNKRGPRQTRLPLKQKAPYKGYSEEMGF